MKRAKSGVLHRDGEFVWASDGALLTDDQHRCMALLLEWAGGFHHLPEIRPFGSGLCTNIGGDLSTFDFDQLTRLVLLAHAHRVRVSIMNGGPRAVKIAAHARKETGSFFERHPGLEDLKKTIEGMM